MQPSAPAVRFPHDLEEGGLASKRNIPFEDGDRASRAAWLRIRRWHVATAVVSWIVWLAESVLMLLGGGVVPDLDDRLDATSGGARRRRSGAYPAWLVLRPTTGWPREWQVDFEKSLVAAWRGPGAMAWGSSWVRNGALTWTPNRTWAQLGARGFALLLEGTALIQRTQLSRQSVGLMVRQSDGAEVWLWLRGKDSVRLSELLRTFASQVNG